MISSRAMIGQLASTHFATGFTLQFRIGLWQWAPFAFEIVPADRYWIVTRCLTAANDP
jgi:hypothetical protein